jgi:hypothetical protein
MSRTPEKDDPPSSEDTHQVTSNRDVVFRRGDINSYDQGEVAESNSIQDVSPIRASFGNAITNVSELINDNLIVARFTLFATIGVVSAYGIAHTPLFFRFRTVADIPSKLFVNRKSIHCRIVRVQDTSKSDEPIILWMRHLSPMERILSKSAFELLMKFHPSRSFADNQLPYENPKELLKIQLSGVIAPPLSSEPYSIINSSANTTEWLRQWAVEQNTVKCRLLARKVTISDLIDNKTHNGHQNLQISNKRPIPEIKDNQSSTTTTSSLTITQTLDQTAVATISYRSKSFHMFPYSDLGEFLVRYGRAIVGVNGLMYFPRPHERVTDVSDSVRYLRKDVAYMDSLGRAELEACRGQYGIWAITAFRSSRKDIVGEVEFQEQATGLQKVWRWLRGG